MCEIIVVGMIWELMVGVLPEPSTGKMDDYQMSRKLRIGLGYKLPSTVGSWERGSFATVSCKGNSVRASNSRGKGCSVVTL